MSMQQNHLAAGRVKITAFKPQVCVHSPGGVKLHPAPHCTSASTKKQKITKVHIIWQAVTHWHLSLLWNGSRSEQNRLWLVAASSELLWAGPFHRHILLLCFDWETPLHIVKMCMNLRLCLVMGQWHIGAKTFFRFQPWPVLITITCGTSLLGHHLASGNHGRCG